VGAHGARRRFGVAPRQGLDDGLVFVATGLAPLRTERSTFYVTPKILIADQPQDLEDVSKYPPAKPAALQCEPPKAALPGR